MYRAYITRASEFGPPERDNSAADAASCWQLRHEEGALLGHATYAAPVAGAQDGALARRGDWPSCATWHAARGPTPNSELAEMREFAARELGLPELQAWDLLYAAEQLKEARYAFSEPGGQAVLHRAARAGGPVPAGRDAVRRAPSARTAHRSGTTACASIASGAAASRWRPFYLDPYARAGKRSGAWMDECRAAGAGPTAHCRLPVAHLVCNFAPPVGEQAGAADATTTSSRCSTNSATACTTC